MQINKKTIIILIVVAVAAFLLWKRSKMRTVTADTGSGGYVDDGSVEGIVAASGMTTADARYVRSFANSVESSLSKKAEMESKALLKGYTYEQMVVLDALWTKYCQMVSGASQFKDGITDQQKSYYWTVTQKIKNY